MGRPSVEQSMIAAKQLALSIPGFLTHLTFRLLQASHATFCLRGAGYAWVDMFESGTAEVHVVELESCCGRDWWPGWGEREPEAEADAYSDLGSVPVCCW